MKVTQEKLPASQIGLEIEIASETTKKTYEQVVQNLARTANIPGFRKGKVPRPILLQRLGMTRIKAAALEEIIQDGITKALEQEKIPAIGQPRLRSSFDDLIANYEPGKPLTFAAAVDVEPEIHLKQYTGLTVQAEEVKYNPEKVDEVLEKERMMMANLVPVEGRPCQLGDVAVVDFKGVFVKAEGEEEPIPGGEANDFQIELQEDKFIPGFISGMVGMNLGETKEITAQFPDPYPNEELAGKPAKFTVTLKDLKAKELPPYNDDFAQEVSDKKTMAELRQSLEEKFQQEASDRTKSNQQEALLTELIKHVEIDLPETLIDKEIDAMLTQTAIRLSQQGLDIKKFFTPEVIPQLRERSRAEACDRIKRSLTLREIGKRESLTTSPEEIQQRLQEILAEYGDEDIDLERLQSVVENDLLTEKILDWLLSQSHVELVPEGTLNKPETDVTETDVVEVGETETSESTES